MGKEEVMKRAAGVFAGIVCLFVISLTPPVFSQEAYKFELMWGVLGTGNGQFNEPGGVAVDGSGSVYVADTGNSCIKKFDSNGNFITQWGSTGTGNGQFSYPKGLALDSSGHIYVAE